GARDGIAQLGEPSHCRRRDPHADGVLVEPRLEGIGPLLPPRSEIEVRRTVDPLVEHGDVVEPGHPEGLRLVGSTGREIPQPVLEDEAEGPEDARTHTTTSALVGRLDLTALPDRASQFW